MPKPDDITLIQQLLFDLCDYNYTQPTWDKESKDYNSCTFKVNSLKVICRSAKITPTKTGQFVTLWKRRGNGPIQPLDITDEFDRVIISADAGDNFGCFIFSKDILLKKGVLANNGKGGKRAIRVYPPWDATSSQQARSSQTWQSDYFVNISAINEAEHNQLKKLLSEA